MTEKEIKLKIGNVVHNHYHGTYNHFKKALAIRTIGQEAYTYICNKIHPDLHYSHSLMMHCFMNDIILPPKCICGTNTKFNTTTRKFQKYCSNKCRFDNFSDSLVQRKKTNLVKYGRTNVLASNYGKNKSKNTMLDKYGVDNYTKTSEYKQQALGKKHSLEGLINIKQGQLKKSFNQLGKKYPHCSPLFKLEEYTGVKGYIRYNWKCNTCGSPFSSSCDNGSFPICSFCEPKGSAHERLCKDFLDELQVSYRFRAKVLPNNKELDIYVENKNFGIELCGLYYHSTAKNNYPKEYHSLKTSECDNLGIKLFTVFDDEMFDPNKRKIVLNKIKHNLGLTARKIPARKCKIVDLSPPVCNRFLEKYHIQGSIGSTYKYGLTYKNRLVAVMTFNKGRTATGHKAQPDIWELGRYCTVFNFSIIGGASKLLSHFIKHVNPKQIYSYADRRWSGGNLYEKLGFTFIKNTSPNYWYTKTFKTREHRIKFQKHKLTPLSSYNPSLTEEEIMKREKYFRIWDCGSKLYTWTKPSFSPTLTK